MSDAYVHTTALLGTVVTIQIVGHGANAHQQRERKAGVARATAWFERVNDDCTRFDAASELMRLSATVGTPVPVSALLFEALRFALAVAEESGGAFDPTVGHRMAARGFNCDFRTGTAAPTIAADNARKLSVTSNWTPMLGTVTLRRPLSDRSRRSGQGASRSTWRRVNSRPLKISRSMPVATSTLADTMPKAILGRWGSVTHATKRR